MIESISIRKEDDADFDAIYDVVEKAFDSEVQANMVSRLREDSHPQLSLVAEVENKLVGHIFYSPVTIENNTNNLAAAQLSPVSILPKYQGKGLGSILIKSGFEQCIEIGWSALFLVGNPLYYYRFGFEMAKIHDFTHEGPHADFLQCKKLSGGAFKFLSGDVKFHSVFEGLIVE